MSDFRKNVKVVHPCKVDGRLFNPGAYVLIENEAVYNRLTKAGCFTDASRQELYEDEVSKNEPENTQPVTETEPEGTKEESQTEETTSSEPAGESTEEKTSSEIESGEETENTADFLTENVLPSSTSKKKAKRK